ncbi:pimeloyl-ACP methyl ester carboxylesterase [Pontibacter ummariensis]|uniref:Pimeloyl-ACP methyl ester carboxylesterase n=1 Tax=Pontibacter ummariensis TaxID=1610492 RepID=A0A239I962_9BACT|nr:alpha/beta hydrolase [Pontibacter ummariensis]PRY09988.1 pimeloyl-ACP methyl ester carboxylesterase [Pontibacter ummariensis]SNS89858.1 Pimeloyl-ACP methyl ester carboxylesterase [Pontibacter ummariensis]
MPFIKTDDVQKVEHVHLHYQDCGRGQPVILIHGWPLSHRMWEHQVQAIVDAGFRCISYDRRGFGDSDRPWNNYDYNSLALDLRHLIQHLNLWDCVLVGFSMGGGEVVRYLSMFGNDRINKAVLISSIIPMVKKTDDNPKGVPEEKLNSIMDALENKRVTFLAEFGKLFYNYEDNREKVSEEQLRYDWTIASFASPRGTIETARAWANTDFRSELRNVSVPTLIIHGDADQIVPIETSSEQSSKEIRNNKYIVIKDGPHGLFVTHQEELNQHLLSFLRQ